MKIRAIIPNEVSHASSWWRIIRPFTMLQTRGHDATWHEFDKLDGVDFKDALVIIHRIIPANPKTYVQLLYTSGARKVVYSNDDHTTDPEALREYLEASGGLTSDAIRRMTDRSTLEQQTIKLCSALIVSSGGLADLEQDLNTNLVVLSNALDIDWYVEALSQTPDYIGNSNTVYIGYASGRRPELDMVHMARAWQRLDNEFENVRFVVAGWQPDILDRHINLDKKIRIPFAPLNDWPKSMQVDIGCCPLSPDIKFNHGKSPIKYYEYSMAGAAVVASPLVYGDTVFPHITGYIAKNEDDWYKYLKALVIDKSLRTMLQDNAQYGIKNYSSLEATIENWEFQLGALYED